MSMSMIDRPRLLLRYCRTSSIYTENQEILLGISNYLQCIKTGAPFMNQAIPAPAASECRSMRKWGGIC